MTQKRSSINASLTGNFGDFPFIDHARNGGFGEFNAPGWPGTPWHQCIDAQGYVNSPTGQNKTWAKLFYIPTATQYSGNWIVDWQGNGEFEFLVTSGSFNVVAHTGSDFVEVATGHWKGTDCSITLTFPGNTDGRMFMLGLNTDASSTGAYFKKFRMYRSDHAGALAAGKVWNPVYIQKFVELNPAVVREMDGHATNASMDCRWEYRAKVNYNGWTPGGGIGNQYFTDAAYPDATGTNIYSVAAIGTTPASLKHGELAHVRIPNAIARGGSISIQNVTQANPAQVSTFAVHGLANGDLVEFYDVVGMTQLLDNEYTVANATGLTFQLQGIDSTAYGTFMSGTCSIVIKINVGARGSKPIRIQDGYHNIGLYPTFVTANAVKTLIYDKPTDSWLVPILDGGLANGIPLEILAQFFVEVNAATQHGPISPWFCIPHMALRASDADYSTGSDFVKNMIALLKNGDGTYGPIPSQCDIYLEHSNETWNAAFGFFQTGYLAQRGFLRWANSRVDLDDFSTLRAILLFNDAVAAYGSGSARLKRVMGLQAGLAGQTIRWNGSATLTGDVLWPGGAPATYYDFLAFASYLDDVSGTTTLENAATAYAGGDASQIDVANNIFKSNSQSGTGWYLNTVLPLYKPVATTYNLGIIMYEGAWGPNYASYSATAKSFFDAIKADSRWANNVVKPFWGSWIADPQCSLPCWFDFSGVQTWSVWYPDIYASTKPAWTMMVAFNAVSPGLQDKHDGIYRWRKRRKEKAPSYAQRIQERAELRELLAKLIDGPIAEPVLDKAVERLEDIADVEDVATDTWLADVETLIRSHSAEDDMVALLYLRTM